MNQCSPLLPLAVIINLFLITSAFSPRISSLYHRTFCPRTISVSKSSSLSVSTIRREEQEAASNVVAGAFTSQKTPLKLKWPEKKETRSPVTDINSIKEFLDFVFEDEGSNKERQLCVIKYHANFCRQCKLVKPKYNKLALDFGDQVDKDSVSIVKRGSARFASVEFTANPEICKALDITKFPFVEIYDCGEKIAAFSTGASYKFGVVQETLRNKLKMTAEEKEDFRKQFANEIQMGKKVLQQLKTQL